VNITIDLPEDALARLETEAKGRGVSIDLVRARDQLDQHIFAAGVCRSG
jgi:hypothetical protein